MANALDSAYEWGINKQNQGNLSAQELLGLQSLSPRGGYGLSMPAPRAALDAYGKLPTPQFADNAARDYFSFMDRMGKYGSFRGSNTVPASNQMMAPEAKVDAAPAAGSAAPHFDPNYPYESMLALKNWLAPQVAAGVTPAANARGLAYSGVGKYMGDDAQNYLSQLAPLGETGPQAMENDFNYLYGPNIADSLVAGGVARNKFLGYNTHGGPQYGNVTTKPSIYGADPVVPGGGTNAAAEFLKNPNYGPGAPAPPQGIGIPERAGSSPPSGNPNVPQFGLYDLASGNEYAGPGYFYDANVTPDASKMPWLRPATPYSGS